MRPVPWVSGRYSLPSFLLAQKWYLVRIPIDSYYIIMYLLRILRMSSIFAGVCYKISEQYSALAVISNRKVCSGPFFDPTRKSQKCWITLKTLTKSEWGHITRKATKLDGWARSSRNSWSEHSDYSFLLSVILLTIKSLRSIPPNELSPFLSLK